MDLTLLALALSGGAGLWTVGQKGELILPDSSDILTEIGFPAFSYASIQDDGLYLSYTDDSCIDDLKVKGPSCANGTNVLGILDTAGQEEFSDVVLAMVDGELTARFMDYTDDDTLSDFVACGEGDGIIASELDSGFHQTGVLQLRKSASWDLLAHVQTTGLVYQKIEGSFAGTDTTLSCVAFSGGEPVAETTIALRNADRLLTSPQSVTGKISHYRGSWVE